MSTMLGFEEHGDAMDPDEIDKGAQKTTNKKISPTIKSFFHSVPADKEIVKNNKSCNNINNFFIKSLSGEPPKSQDSVDNEKCAQQTNEIESSIQNVKRTKKNKPKWSLTIKSSKKSNNVGSESDVEEILEDISEQMTEEHSKDKIPCKVDGKTKIKNEQKTNKTEVNASKINDFEQVCKEVACDQEVKDLLRSKQTEVEEIVSDEGASDYHRKKSNALEILMNNSRNRKNIDNEVPFNTDSIQLQKHPILENTSNDCDIKIAMEITNVGNKSSKQSSKESASDSGAGNAFDILMKKPSNDSKSENSHKRSKNKGIPFKLNIRYSKTSNDSDCESNQEEDTTLQISQEETVVKPLTSKSRKKVYTDSSSEISENRPHTQSNSDSISNKNDSKMTKIKKKKEKAERVSKEDNAIVIQEDSNSSIYEMTETSHSETGTGVFTSPGIEDFELSSLRKGLRRRKPSVNDVLLNVNKDKNKEGKEETEKKSKRSKKKGKTKEKKMTEDSKKTKERNLKEEDVVEEAEWRIKSNKECTLILNKVPKTSTEKSISAKKKASTKSKKKESIEVTTNEALLCQEEKKIPNTDKPSEGEKKSRIKRTAKTKGAFEEIMELDEKGVYNKEKGSAGTKDKGASGTIEKGTVGTKEKGSKGIQEKGALGTIEKGPLGTKEKGSKCIKGESTKVKEKQRGIKVENVSKKKTIVVNSDASPDVEEIMSVKRVNKEKEEKAPKAPQKLAPIFLKQKPKEKPKSDATKSTKNDAEFTDKAKPEPAKQLNEEELKAANTAFLALFASSKTIKAAQKPAVQVSQQPTPLPIISHVTQWSEEELSALNVVNEKLLEESLEGPPIKRKNKLKLGQLTNSQSDEIILKSNLKKVEDLEKKSLSSGIVKTLLSEACSFYPGIPIRRLYKHYRRKQDENETDVGQEFSQSSQNYKQVKGESEENVLIKGGEVEGKAIKRGRPKREGSSQNDVQFMQESKAKTAKDCSVKEGHDKDVDTKRGRPKRKISTQSDEEQTEKEVKKPRKKKHKEINKEEIKIPIMADSEKTTGENDEGNSKTSGKNKRKKRKTMPETLPDATVVQNSTETTKSEDSRCSVDEKKVELPWTDKYQPDRSSEVMGNASSVSRLKSWLEAWKIKREKTLRKELELQKRLLAKQKNKEKHVNKSEPGWREEDYDSDFHISDEESDESDSEYSGLSSAILLVGPRGSGKTATVYACAKELGYKVFEVNCSSKRSSKQILSKLEETTQSHLVVRNSTATTPKASSFSGLFKKASDTSSLSVFTKEKNEGKRSGKRNKREMKEGTFSKKRPLDLVEESSMNSRLAEKTVSLILFEEVDLVFEDDKGFWSAVTSFINNAKCPIVMTSNDSRVSCDGRYEQLVLKTPSINLLSAHLQLAALVNNVIVHPDELKALVSLNHCDIRKCFLALQFWVMSGGGRKTKWKKFLKQQDGVKVTKEAPSDVCKKATTSSTWETMKNAGEESLLLTSEDWKNLTTRSTRASKRGLVGEPENSDSDFEARETCVQPVDVNSHTDSLLMDGSESQSVQIVDDKNPDMPGVHCLLVEHTLGLLNTSLSRKHGCLDVLKYRNNKTSSQADKLRLTQYSHALGVTLMNHNLSSLLPSLFTEPSTNANISSVTKATLQPINTEEKNLDTSVFDDGCEVNQESSCQVTETMETKKLISGECKLIEEESVKKDGSAKLLQSKTLEFFTAMAEDLSFMDAFTMSPDITEIQPADYGWWHARASPGLSDDATTVCRSSRDCWTRDSSESIRGDMEAACYDCACVRYKSLLDDGLTSSHSRDFLPERRLGTVVNLTGLTDVQIRKISSTNRLYRTVSSSLSPAAMCSRRSTCTDYLPTLRSICYSERLREIGNTKRRFLHYLDSNSSMSDSSMQLLADEYLLSYIK